MSSLSDSNRALVAPFLGRGVPDRNHGGEPTASTDVA
jgi:hypothetical protein